MRWGERVTLAMLATVGATAMDTAFGRQVRERFESKFNVKIDDETIASVVDKLATVVNGAEEVW